MTIQSVTMATGKQGEQAQATQEALPKSALYWTANRDDNTECHHGYREAGRTGPSYTRGTAQVSTVLDSKQR